MKRSIRLFLLVPTVALLIAATCYLSFKAIEQSIIEENEALVHSVAQSLMPALLAGDTQQVDDLLKTLEKNPSIQTAELISGSGIPLASYVRDGAMQETEQMQFALASSEDTLSKRQLHVMAPLTFDTQILANLHIAINLWPAYLRIIQWLGVLLIVPSALFVLVKKQRIKIRLEKVFNDSGAGPDSFNVEQALKDALHESDISVEYQPVKRLADRGIFGAEVVICWKHPSGQTIHVSPADFIALAERSGLFLPFGNWVMETACKQMANWQRQHGPLVLSINISPSQLKDANFYQTLRQICASTQYPHQLIEFEMNEAVLLRQTNALADIEAFTQQGMSLTIDGFGLSPRAQELLQGFSIHKIKFAPQLIKNIAHDPEMRAFVDELAGVALAHDVQIMADGLHNEQQTQEAVKLGCTLGQGAYFSPPMSSRQFEDLLVNQTGKALAPSQLASGPADAVLTH